MNDKIAKSAKVRVTDKAVKAAGGINGNADHLLQGIERLIEQAGKNVAVYLNTAVCRLYWSIGNHIIAELRYETYSEYGQQILATLSQRLTGKY